MDPFSIVTTSATLVDRCAKLTEYLYKYVKKIQNVDMAVQVLQLEITTLQRVLGSIGTSFSDPAMAQVALETLTGHEAQHWENVKRSMEDCEVTLTDLDKILENVTNVGDGFFRRAKTQVKLDMKSTKMTLLKQQVTAYRQTMQLSLQMLTVTFGLRQHANISATLEELTVRVSSLIESFNESQRPRSRESATDEESTVIANLRDCVRSAERMVSSATSIVVARSSQGSQLQSDYGDGLTEAQRRRIEDWITQPTILEDVETNNVELQTNPSNTGDISGTTSLPDPIPDSSSEGQSDTSNVPAIFQRRTSREWPLASLPPLPPQLPAGLRPSLRKKPSTRKPLRSKINPKAENSQESTSVAKTFESQQNTQGEIYQENDPVSKILDSKKNTETDPIPDSSSEGQSDTRSHRSFVNLRKGDSGRTFQGEVRIPRRRRSLSLAVPQKDAPTTIQSKNNPELENSQEGVSVAKTLASQKNPETDPIADSSSETSEPVAKLPVIKPFRRVLASYIKEAALKRKLESKSNPEAENPQETTSVPKAEAGNSQENSTVSKFWGSKGPSKSEDLWKRGIPFTSEENEVKANNWQKLYARVSPGFLIFPSHDEVIANFERWETLCDQNTPDGRRSWRGLMVADRLGTRIGLPYPSLGKEFRVGDVVLVTSLEGDGVATGFKLRRRIRELARLKADVSWFKDLTKVWADKNSHSFYYTNFCHWRLCIKEYI